MLEDCIYRHWALQTFLFVRPLFLFLLAYKIEMLDIFSLYFVLGLLGLFSTALTAHFSVFFFLFGPRFIFSRQLLGGEVVG
jgi:hypothetical protein